jgi:aspartokinase-like uncharacterized kinase
LLTVKGPQLQHYSIRCTKEILAERPQVSIRMNGHDSSTQTVLKVGGSLIEVATDLIDYLVAAHVDALVVPGGGPFAQTVRHYAARTDETTAHWMAILATNQYGFYLASSGAELVEDLRAVERGIRILLPFRVLYERDPLPHSWNATADSIAGWVAHQLNADLVIATDVDGIFSANEVISTIAASDLTSETCVDALLPELLEKYELNCTIVNGRQFQRVVDAISGHSTIGTTIIGRK